MSLLSLFHSLSMIYKQVYVWIRDHLRRTLQFYIHVMPFPHRYNLFSSLLFSSVFLRNIWHTSVSSHTGILLYRKWWDTCWSPADIFTRSEALSNWSRLRKVSRAVLVFRHWKTKTHVLGLQTGEQTPNTERILWYITIWTLHEKNALHLVWFSGTGHTEQRHQTLSGDQCWAERKIWKKRFYSGMQKPALEDKTCNSGFMKRKI